MIDMIDPAITGSPVNGVPFLAADVGGTHARLALVRAGAAAGRPVEVLAFQKYDCTDHSSLVDFISEFLAAHGGGGVNRGVVASAGYALDDGTVITTNLPWPLSIRETRERLGFADLRLVNDFEAVAYAAATLPTVETTHITGPYEALVRGPVLVLGPGTGLGAALWIPHGERPFVLATEAGHAALAASTELELALLAQLLKQHRHVTIEHVLSGPGILNLYRALAVLRGAQPALSTPNQITAAAQAGDDALARETLEIFCGFLGSVVGDMALTYGAQGGIRLAGGVLPQIRDFLLRSDFVSRYLNKGPMCAALERIPVRLVEHGQLGVVGAAHWYLD
ncbi:glucokinase [Pseudoxanthomonas sp. CF125]|uniref:glucokinase n=1 Tax=Pseudoxanthomonas sp. CF125 TaxID=1855303 RepID=UPI00088044B3|nr:glucokinase [Pseudoxanthomonas sp. CF125]SDQ31540.1 glucokinase [Pseudoxanthomonas sp. CF125]